MILRILYGGEGLYTCGEMIVYGIHGVCRVLDIETRSVDKKQVEYYVLEPLEQPGTRYYIPTQNQAATAKLRPVLRKEELQTLLKSIKSSKWIPDENQRKQLYKTLICNTDPAALIGIVCTLHKQKDELISSGKKFHLCDENFLRDAEKLLVSEFSLILNIDQQDVRDYVQKIVVKD